MLEPVQIAEKLELIEKDLEDRQQPLAQAAHAWFLAKRDKEKEWGTVYLSLNEGTTVERKAVADVEAAKIGKEEEAVFEARKRAIMVLETRASILQTLAKVGR